MATRWRWLAARELVRPPVEVVAEVENGCSLGHAPRTIGPGGFGDLQRIGHVLERGHVRIECIVLEHHGAAAVCRIDLVHNLAVYGDGAADDLFQTRDHAQERRLPTARRPDDDDEFSVFDCKVDMIPWTTSRPS